MKQELKQWRFLFEGECYSCQLPATMYGILLQEGKIPDPYYRDNEKSLTALSEKNCSFETVVNADDELLSHRHLLLRFEGIDTVADIFLNGERLAHVENMHRIFEVDVSGLFLPGENRISVDIFSPLRYMREGQKRHPIPGNAESIDGVAQIRKASYMMGWDWGPELPDMGIWRPVYLVAYDEARLLTPAFRQYHEDGRVRLSCHAELEGTGTSVRFSLRAPDGRLLQSCEADRRGEVCFTVEDPQLWWPNGYGEQPLYTVHVSLSAGERIVDEAKYSIGLRTLTVSTQRDRYGNEFCFVVNGEKIFAMGANYIPEDNLLGRRSEARTDALLRKCADANFNMIRVWGGGFYPDDCFYELCDRYGLIVWQDFMIACNSIWLTDSREENLMLEFRENLTRIRHHACLGLLNGNNEIEAGMAHGKTPRNTPLLVADYLRLYHRLLPELCQELAPDTFYWPSSPSSGQCFDGSPSDETRGDCHYWQVWHNWLPYEEYRKHYFRFCSEYGFEALPEPLTLESFTEPRDRNLFSPVMLTHQKCRAGNGKLMAYLSDYYLYPKDFRGVLYGSQLLQADAIRTAVEHFRRHRGRCMGSLYWQLNDCWPTVSWSSLDSAGRKKALHYAAKRFYAPVLLSAHESGNIVTFNISNEQRHVFEGSVGLSLRDVHYREVWQERFDATLEKLSSRDVKTVDFTPILADREHTLYLVYTLYDRNGMEFSRAVHLFVRPKCFAYKKPNIRYELTPCEEGLCLHLQSDVFAHRLRVDFGEMDVQSSDRYVDLTDADGCKIMLYGMKESDISALRARLSFFSVYDIAPECYQA